MPLSVRVPYEWTPRDICDGGDYEKNEWNQWYCWHCYKVADESHVGSVGHIKKLRWHQEERQRIGAQPPPGFPLQQPGAWQRMPLPQHQTQQQPTPVQQQPPAWHQAAIAAAAAPGAPEAQLQLQLPQPPGEPPADAVGPPPPPMRTALAVEALGCRVDQLLEGAAAVEARLARVEERLLEVLGLLRERSASAASAASWEQTL